MSAANKSKHLLLGISGGIAAYKSAELVRLAVKAGWQVRVMMTRSATEFITPLTLQALSGNPVHCELLDPGTEQIMGHIDLARWADQVLIAPASANLMARLAHGLADDLVSTTCLATQAPVSIAPAMNRQMWQAPASQANLNQLQRYGFRILGPATGQQACGETGRGRLLEPEHLLAALNGTGPDLLQGMRVLITAGPTREPIDPVRYISNRSSGRMGYAIALAARDAGAQVTLVSGPVNLPVPAGMVCVPVETAAEMHEQVMAHVAGQQIFVATAAVADYRPRERLAHKLKKESSATTLTLLPNTDILSSVAALPGGPFTVGFAAETNDLEHYARDKLLRKGLDMIAANQVGDGLGFDTEDNALQVFWAEGDCLLERAPKTQLAQQLWLKISECYGNQRPTQDP